MIQDMNFEEDIRQHVLQNLRRDPRADRELKSKSARDLLIIYGNWLNRLVSTRPRTVHCSTALAANQLASDPRYAPGLAGIETKLRNGRMSLFTLARTSGTATIPTLQQAPFPFTGTRIWICY